MNEIELLSEAARACQSWQELYFGGVGMGIMLSVAAVLAVVTWSRR